MEMKDLKCDYCGGEEFYISTDDVTIIYSCVDCGTKYTPTELAEVNKK